MPKIHRKLFLRFFVNNSEFSHFFVFRISVTAPPFEHSSDSPRLATLHQLHIDLCRDFGVATRRWCLTQ